MKLVLVERADQAPTVALLTQRGIVPVAEAESMEQLIDDFTRRRADLDPNDLWVQFWNDGQLRHNHQTDDMEHRVPELIEFASRNLTLRSGDLIACGTNHEGLGPVQDGETLEMLIHGIGRMILKVEDPLKRTWERGIYMGPGLCQSRGGAPQSATRRAPPARLTWRWGVRTP